MLRLAEFDWEHAQIVAVTLDLAGGTLALQVEGVLTSDQRNLDGKLRFGEIAYIAVLRGSSMDYPPTQVGDFQEWEGIRTPAVELGENGQFIQMNFIDGWSRATPRAASFDSYNTYSLVAGALRLEWICASFEVSPN